MKKHIFSGCATALISPFTADGKEVDYSSFEKIVNFQIENSIDALVVAGTTGESPVLTSEEKTELIKIAKSSAGNNIPVIAGTGSNSTIEAVKKSNEAEKQGVNGLLIVTPYYNKCSQEGLINHYFYIADRVSTPIIVYNVPSRTGMTVKAETYKALSEHKNIIAVKEASTDIGEIIKSISLCGDLLSFYSGNDDLTIPLMSFGADGLISVTSNLIPGIMKKITLFCNNDDFSNANKLQKKYQKLINAMFCDINPIPIKYACSKLQLNGNYFRAPLTPLTENKEVFIENILSEYELI